MTQHNEATRGITALKVILFKEQQLRTDFVKAEKKETGRRSSRSRRRGGVAGSAHSDHRLHLEASAPKIEPKLLEDRLPKIAPSRSFPALLLLLLTLALAHCSWPARLVVISTPLSITHYSRSPTASATTLITIIRSPLCLPSLTARAWWSPTFASTAPSAATFRSVRSPAKTRRRSEAAMPTPAQEQMAEQASCPYQLKAATDALQFHHQLIYLEVGFMAGLFFACLLLLGAWYRIGRK